MAADPKLLHRALERELAIDDENVIGYIGSVISEGVESGDIRDAGTFGDHVMPYFDSYDLAQDEAESELLSGRLFNLLRDVGALAGMNQAEIDKVANLKEKSLVMAKYWEDEKWYLATIDKSHQTKEWDVSFKDYGNLETVDIANIKPLHFAYKKTLLDVPVRIADSLDDEHHQKTNKFLQSLQTETIKCKGDTTNYDPMAILNTKERKAARKAAKQAERLRLFDPDVYYEKNRAKPRMEWLDFTQNSCIDINIPHFNLYTLDDKHDLLEDTNLKLNFGQHYALIGRNGTGKTTLLRRISRYDIDEFPKHVRVFHCEQEIRGNDTPVLQYVMESDSLLMDLNNQLDLLEKDDSTESANKMMQIQDQLISLGASDSERRAKEILMGLHFEEQMLTWPTKRLSGGWRMRVALASALFVNPDILLLDEPTNHLDFPSVCWLENYLKKLDTTLVVVSHDRHFLNNVVDTIIFLDEDLKQLVYYKGNYRTFEKTRRDEYVHNCKAYKTQRAQIAHIEAFITKFRANPNRAPMVQSRIKSLKAMEKVPEPRNPDAHQIDLKFPECQPCEGFVARTSDLLFGYAPDNILINCVNSALEPTSRVGMIGANGAGKSTYIKLLVEQLEPLHGEVTRNKGCRLAVFTQHHIDQLDLHQTAVEFMMEKFADDIKDIVRKQEHVRKYLGRFGIHGDLPNQRMFFLSGGQKSRVAFATLTWNKPSFIIMDEPTNHLDMETIDALIRAIHQYEGGLLVVSHDQYFLQNVVKQYWALKDGAIHIFREFNAAKKFSAKS